MDYQYKKTIADFNLEVLNMEIEELCEKNEFLSTKLFTIQLIIEELVTNIVKYGGKTGTDKSVEIEIHTEQGQTILTISDNTDSFNPLTVEDPDTTLSAEERNIGGLGLFLVRKKVQSLIYENNNGMNIVRAVLL
jgi:anti-sigma regulatory factor (Ser/Thr protein kinase)